MQKLWIASELFFPEETSTSFILTKVANKLVEKYDVKVICGVPIQERQSISSTFFLDPKVSLHRVHSWFKDKNSLLQRSLRFIYLSFSIFFYLLWRVKKHDKVLIVTNPAPLILLISLLKLLKSNKLIILVHDVFPENTVPAGIFKSQNSLPYKILKKIFDWAYRNADLLIVLGRDMHEVIASKIGGSGSKNKIKIIENWADTDQIYPLNKSEHEDTRLKCKIVFQY
ncbi:MAG: glycosyltransferase, partial [Kaistella sp.]